MTASVRCPKCGQQSTAFYCDCGKDLRSLIPGVTKNVSESISTSTRIQSVEQFLESLAMESHSEAFRDNEVTFDLLPSLSDDDLKELGVQAVGHRRKILDAASKLRARSQVELPPSAFPPPSNYSPVAAPSTPGIVVAGFILAFVFPAIGFVISMIGLGEARQRGAGVGLATSGAVIGAALTLLFVPLACLSGF